MSPMLLALPVFAPLAGVGMVLLLSRRGAGSAGAPPRIARAVGWGVTVVVLVASMVLLTSALDGDIATLRLGAWPAGIAIVLVADVLGALMMAVTSLLVLLSPVFACVTGQVDGHLLSWALLSPDGSSGARLGRKRVG